MDNTIILTLQDELEIFKTNWGSIKCFVDKEFITYKTTPGWSAKAATRANDLIKTLGLNLKAESTSFAANDSFCVKSAK